MLTFSRTLVAAGVGVLVAAGCGQQTPETSGSITAARLSGCQTANGNVEYRNLLVVPDETKILIESYRSAWKTFCDVEKQARPSMADLLVQAKEIELRFDNVFETYRASRKSSEPPRSEDDAVSDLVVKKYPSFIPAFEGSYFEYEYFRPSFEEFEKHTPLGTAEDKRFFDTGIRLGLEFPRPGRWNPPWMEKTWDYGGCFRFGEFRWTEALDQIVKLKADLHSEIYRKMTSDWEMLLMEDLAFEGNVCTCKNTDAVIEDLQAALLYLQRTPALSAFAPDVQAKLQSIQAKKVKVESEAQKHCSGG
jgi:hypothetical protein